MTTLNLWEYAAREFEPTPPDPYQADPTGWAGKKLNAHLWSKQQQIFDSVRAHKRTAVKSCHGSGKSWSAGALATWWIDTHPPGEAIVVSTAPTYKQVHAVLWQEIRKQHKAGELKGRILGTDEWMINDLLVGMGRKPADHDEHGFQGIHRRYVLVILDEACGIPAPLWTAVEAITTNDDCRILAIGNPDDPNTEFGAVCRPGSGWNVLQISTFDTPNYTGEPIPDYLEHLLPGASWADEMAKRWGKDSPRYQSKVLGEFPESSTDTLIPQAWITRAQDRARDRDESPTGPVTLGVDVARFGTDETVTAALTGRHLGIVDVQQGNATTETTGRTVATARRLGAVQVRVDGVGVGAGVVDQLVEQLADGTFDVPVLDMQAGAASTDPVLFKNARAQWYWNLRKAFEEDLVDLDPDDDTLASQLASLKYVYDSRGRILIESKDDMKRRGLPSPDRADAVMLAYANAALPVPATVVDATTLLTDDYDDDLDWAETPY